MIKELHSEKEVLWSTWYKNALRYPNKDAIVFWSEKGHMKRWTFSNLINSAERIALALLDNGISHGDVCGIILRHNPFLYPLYLAISCIGGIPAVLAFPNARLHPDKFREGLMGMSERSGLDWILSERELEATLAPLLIGHKSTVKGMHFPLEWKLSGGRTKNNIERLVKQNAGMSQTEPCLLQHSSGTTGLQKPVMLSHQSVLKHCINYGKEIKVKENDKVISWLPLYHDMGLIAAFHLPLIFGIPSVQIDPFEWVISPMILLKAITKEKGTICWLPNFAFNMMAEKIRDEDIVDIDLSSLRMVINCSEPIRYESNQKMLKRFAKVGLKKSAISSCYAMAETTFAVTQTPAGKTPKKVEVDRVMLSRGKVKPAKKGKTVRVCVSSGVPIKGCKIKIGGYTGKMEDESRIGEIIIRSESMFNGYRNYPEKTAKVYKDGWYYSGDLGFRKKNDLYVIGRIKDIIIIAGNNIYPEDIEDAVGKVSGVIPGRVVAFGIEDASIGSEKLCVIAETAALDEAQKTQIKKSILKAGMGIDVTISEVVLVPGKWLIKSSSGKPSRGANAERVLAGMDAKREWKL
jgi:fatty-acyl-CoA synthase